MNDEFLDKGYALTCTSIEGARSSLPHISDIMVLKAALKCEKMNMNRITMIRMLTSRIRRVEKEIENE